MPVSRTIANASPSPTIAREIPSLPAAMPNALCRRGRRMSVSTSSTRSPDCAMVIARFTAVVVLPSCGAAEVTSSVLAGRSGVMNKRLVRIARHDSAIGDFGMVEHVQVLSAVAPAGPLPSARARHRSTE